MAKSLEDALFSLDAAIDEHWTKGGKPSLEHLKIVTGNQDLLRSDVEKFGEYERPPLSSTSDDPDDLLTTQELVEAAHGDAVVLMEAVVAAAQTDRYRRNNELQGLVRGFMASQTAIRDLQDRLDQRQTRREDRREAATDSDEDNAE